MKNADEIMNGLADPVPVHFHGGNPEPHLTPLAYKALEALHADALTLIQQLEARVPRWIPVEERLPEKHCVVLVHLRAGIIETGVHNGRNWWNDLGITHNENVTHWMTLPEPPAKGE